jgi:ATP-dependent Clp protease ATP-binding subunit ClpA
MEDECIISAKQSLTTFELLVKIENGVDKGYVMDQDVAEVISRRTGIPVTKLTQSEKAGLLTNQRLRERVVGQDEAINAATECILRSRAGLARDSQPTRKFLFLGPTGVGKTELAKALLGEYV